MSLIPVTVVVPVKNEEKNLAACLTALQGRFQQVIVVDSGSTDATCQIAGEHGALLMNFKWDGQFPKKRNWVLRNYSFQTNWVLFLDADERVTPSFVDELSRAIESTTAVGYWVTYENWFMGKRLRHGDRMRKLSLFRVDAGEYEQFDEDRWSGFDMEIHEHPILDGTIGVVAATIEHSDYRGLHHYIAKHNEYSTWEANRFTSLQRSGDGSSQLTRRQRFKYRYLASAWLGPLYFVVSYFVKLGFLDGSAGWVFARMKWRYFSDIRLKILERRAADARQPVGKQ